MPIEKIPRCPFCNGRMKQEFGITGVEGTAEIILQRETIKPPHPYTIDIDHITHSIKLPMFFCEECGFVALWRGEPR